MQILRTYRQQFLLRLEHRGPRGHQYLSVTEMRATQREVTRSTHEHLLEMVPQLIHTILTDNGIQFAEQPRNRIPHIAGRYAST